MINSLIREYDEKNLENLENLVLNLPLEKLIEVYIEGIRVNLFKKYDYMSEILNIIKKNITIKVSSLDLLDLIKVYITIFDLMINVEDENKTNQNIIDVRELNLKHDFYIDYYSKKNNCSRSEFIDKYTKQLDYYIEISIYLKRMLSNVDELQLAIFNQIEKKIDNLSSEERQDYLIKINDIILANLEEINQRIDRIKNRKLIELEARISYRLIADIYESLDPTKLKRENYVYESIRGTLEHKKKNAKS